MVESGDGGKRRFEDAAELAVGAPRRHVFEVGEAARVTTPSVDVVDGFFAEAMAHDLLSLVEAHAMGEGPYLLGARFSLADLVIATLSRWVGGRVWTPAHCPRIEALSAAVARRPAVAPIWRRHGFGSA